MFENESKSYCIEIRNLGECNYVLEFSNVETGEILEFIKENCLDDCLIDIYEFTKNCCEKYVKFNFDYVSVKVDNVSFY